MPVILILNYILLITLLASTELTAQGRPDSLISLLKQTSGDSKVDLLNEISGTFSETDFEKAKLYADQALELAESSGYEDGITDALINKAVCNWNMGLIEKSRDIFLTALDRLKSDERNDREGLIHASLGEVYNELKEFVKSVNHLNTAYSIYMESGMIDKAGDAANVAGLLLWRRSLYDSALVLYDKAFKARKESGQKRPLGITYNNIGVIHYHQGNYQKALENYFESLDLRRETGDSIGVARVLNNIGYTYLNWGKPDESKDYFVQGLEMGKNIDNSTIIGYSYHGIGRTFEEKAEYDSALAYFSLSHDAYEDKDGKIMDFMSIGRTYNKMGEHAKAIQYLDDAYKGAVEIGNLWGQAKSSHQLGISFIGLEQINKGLVHLERSIELCREMGQKDVLNSALLAASEAHMQLGNSKLAYELYKSHAAVKDSIFSETSLKNIDRLRIQFESEQKELENQILIQEKAAQEKIIRSNNTIMILAGSLFAVVLAVTIVLYRQKKLKNRVNVLLRQSNSEITQSKSELEKKHAELQDALKQVKTLSGLIPICSSCKKVRDDAGYWSEVETFISERLDTDFSHGICPDCMKRLYPDYVNKKTN